MVSRFSGLLARGLLVLGVGSLASVALAASGAGASAGAGTAVVSGSQAPAGTVSKSASLSATGKMKNSAETAASSKTQTAILAGGCFWGMEEVYRKIPGVVATQVGYAGGRVENPSYEQVSSGSTGHAESIQVEFDPTKISYEEVLKVFFRMHDPTSLNRQGNDVGTQYRSEIFYRDEGQKVAAAKVIKLVDASGKWPKPVVTKVEAAAKFYPAEEYHQKYLVKNPRGYNDHFLREFSF